MDMTNTFHEQIARIRQHTASYVNDDEFRRKWNGISHESAAIRAQQLRTFSYMIGDIWESLSNKKILEVGCGNGRVLRWMVELGAKPDNVLGVDVSDIRFKEGNRKNPLIRLTKVDDTNIPADDNTYDLVLQFTCFMCIPTHKMRQKVADEMCRVLKPDGYIFWWDLPTTFIPDVSPEKLRPEDYFENMAIKKIRVSHVPRLSEVIRPLRGFGPVIGRLLNHLGYRPSHVAALIGPKNQNAGSGQQ
jgi:ubiquinone/menaquinone biosynthesis C-methylase UbiE